MAEPHIVYQQAHDHHELNSVINRLLYNQFCRNKKFVLQLDLPNSGQLKKAVWIASILAGSKEEHHQMKAQFLATLLYLQYGDNEEVERLCYLLMSRIGNLTATSLFKRATKGTINNHVLIYDAALSMELAYQRGVNRINVGSEEILTTSFQRELWNSLLTDKTLAISAPTSAGKSYITKKRIKLLFSEAYNQHPRHCLYIVPSRALINQVSEEFRVELEGLANVYTTFLVPDLDTNIIYVLTPERCLRLLKEVQITTFTFDLIFIDEIQNVEEEGGRGTLLEYIIELLGATFPEAQTIVAGPYLNNPAELFKALFGIEANKVKTTLSPVIQIRSVIKGTDSNEVSIKLLSENNDIEEFRVDVGFDLNKELSRNIGGALAGIIKTFAPNEHSIIYSPKTNLAEGWARHYVSQQVEETELDASLIELIDYLSDEVHPKYYLVSCLKKGVAFHHGRLPDLVRREVEEAFKDMKITKIFCTSTLIEGVNMPARNLFIVKPQKLDENLTAFEFGNLIGRAGRIGESLFGNVYCIEQPTNIDWVKPYFLEKFEKTVKPATNKALEEYDSLIKRAAVASTSFGREEELIKNSLVIFRHKYISNPSEFSIYLKTKGLNSSQQFELEQQVSASLKGLTIPASGLRNNPSIDPLLQDILFKQIIAEGTDSWVIHSNKNLGARIKRIDIGTSPTEWPLFYQLEGILVKLDKIFEIRREGAIKHNIPRSISQMCFYGVRWLAGESYSQMVRNDLNWKIRTAKEGSPFNPEDETEINSIINDVTKINNTIVSHLLVKYLKVLNDILEQILTPDQAERFRFSLALPSMLELGTTDGNVIKLMSVGVSRSVAIRVAAVFEKVQGNETLEILSWLKMQPNLNLKPIYNRYLTKLKLLRKVPLE